MYYVVDGVRYHVETWGTGKPLLVLHGFTGDGTSWNRYKSYWQEHMKVIALDIVGHGKSDSPNQLEKYCIEYMAAVIYDILQQMEISQVDMLGYSMGGRLALAFAISYPEKVDKLILESASPGLCTAEEREIRREQDAKLATFIERYGMKRFVEYWEDIPLFHSQKQLSEKNKMIVRKQRLNNCPIGLINSLKGMGTGSQPSYWGELQHLSSPVLLLTGTLDIKFCKIAEKMMKKFKEGQWVKVENCGHAIHVENPEIFGTLVDEFLSL